jgi:VIT1/CCC1 family predicted Fe2+/Mn2+ transporter
MARERSRDANHHIRAAFLRGPGGDGSLATRFAFWRRVNEEALAEKHAEPRLLSDFILGSQDGLVNVLGVILGVAVAARNLTDPFAIILAGGLAATFAESISMGAVAYTSTIARRDHYAAEVERERMEMVEMPDLERQEVREILQRWDFQGEELEEMVEKITSKPKAWLEIMMAHELNLAPVDPKQARKSAVLVGFAAIIGSLIPLAPFFVVRPAVIGGDVLQDLWTGIAASMIVSAATLFFIGWYKARITIGRAGRSGLQMLLIGIGSALAGFGIAYLVSGGAVVGP